MSDKVQLLESSGPFRSWSIASAYTYLRPGWTPCELMYHAVWGRCKFGKSIQQGFRVIVYAPPVFGTFGWVVWLAFFRCSVSKKESSIQMQQQQYTPIATELKENRESHAFIWQFRMDISSCHFFYSSQVKVKSLSPWLKRFLQWGNWMSCPLHLERNKDVPNFMGR